MAGEVREEILSLDRHLKALVGKVKRWEAIVRRLAADANAGRMTYALVRKRLMDMLAELERWQADDPVSALKELILGLAQRLSQEEEKAVTKFVSELADLVERRHGWKVKGHLPNLRAGPYTLEVKVNEGEVALWLGPRQELLEVVHTQMPARVVDRLSALHSTLLASNFDERRFLARLEEAYSLAAARTRRKFGEDVPITVVLTLMALLVQDRRFSNDPRRRNYRDYSRAKFAYELFRTRQREIDGKRLELRTASRAYTRRRSDFIWIPTDLYGNGEPCSHIRFKVTG